jgi:hypothetical protein
MDVSQPVYEELLRRGVACSQEGVRDFVQAEVFYAVNVNNVEPPGTSELANLFLRVHPGQQPYRVRKDNKDSKRTKPALKAHSRACPVCGLRICDHTREFRSRQSGHGGRV